LWCRDFFPEDFSAAITLRKNFPFEHLFILVTLTVAGDLARQQHFMPTWIQAIIKVVKNSDTCFCLPNLVPAPMYESKLLTLQDLSRNCLLRANSGCRKKCRFFLQFFV